MFGSFDILDLYLTAIYIGIRLCADVMLIVKVLL